MKKAKELSSGGVIFRPVKRGGARDADVALISVKGGKVWGLPKGLQEDHENIARTAHREVKEETGLDGEIIENLGSIKYFYSFKDEEDTTRIFKIVYFFLMEYTSGDTSDHDDEVDDCRWFPIDEAIGLMKYEDERGILEKAKGHMREMDYID